jgi:hypothetical protein
MRRSVPPPDFRYVGLQPAPSSREVMLGAAAAGAATFALAVALGGGPEPGTLTAASLVGVTTALLAARRRGPTERGPRSSRAPIAIVPWGVLILAETAPRILRWAAVRAVRVDLVCEMDAATPLTRWSVVHIDTERESFAGRAPGSVALERLEAHFERYAEEAARPIALDLDGTTALDAPLEPVFELLLAEARRLLHGGALSERISLPPASYRDPRGAAVSDEALILLRARLESSGGEQADPRPLACLIAAETGATELAALVVGLTTCPHPLVAAVARAAALRLGTDVQRAGSLDELAEFLPEADLDQLRGWCGAQGNSSRSS